MQHDTADRGVRKQIGVREVETDLPDLFVEETQ